MEIKRRAERKSRLYIHMHRLKLKGANMHFIGCDERKIAMIKENVFTIERLVFFSLLKLFVCFGKYAYFCV